MQKKTMINDLTQGPVTRELLKFAWPFMLSNLLTNAYNLVDMVVIGQVDGSVGLSGVSIGSDVMFLFGFICMGFCTAAQIMISQYVGRGDRTRISGSIGTLFTSTFVMGLLFMSLVLIGKDSFLRWLNTPAEALSQARGYVVVCSAGTVFTFGYQAVSAIMRGIGDSKRPLLFVAVAAVTNVILDVLFVAVFRWGATGAALATIMGQAVSFVWSVVHLYRRREAFGFDFRLKSFKVDPGDLKGMLALGGPLMLQFSAISLSALVVSSFINSYGVTATAVTGVGNKINGLVMIVSNAMNSAGAGMIGQSFGAGKLDRIRKCVRVSLVICLSMSALLAVLILLFPRQAFGLFNRDVDVLDMAVIYAPVSALNFFGFGLRAPFTALVTGIGNAKLSLYNGLADGVVGKIGLALLFGMVLDWGIQGFWYGNVLAGFLPAVISMAYYCSGKWKTRKLAIRTDAPAE